MNDVSLTQQKMEEYSRSLEEQSCNMIIGCQNSENKMVAIGKIKKTDDFWVISLNNNEESEMFNRLLTSFSSSEKRVKKHSAHTFSVETADISLINDLFNAPQGYMARILASKHHDLPDDITQWSHDNIFHSLSLVGQDISGAIAYFNDVSDIEHFNKSNIDPERCLNHNASQIDQVIFLTQYCEKYDNWQSVSNVGGEKPKALLNVIDDDHWYSTIVKYSPIGDTINKEQLIMEHSSMTALRESMGDDCVAQTELHENKETGQVFLLVKREDRGIAFDLSENPSRTHWMSEQAIQRTSKNLGDNPALTQINRTISQLKDTSLSSYRKTGIKKSLQHQLVTFAYNKMIHNNDVHGGNLSNVIGADGTVSSSCSYDVEPHGLRYDAIHEAVTLSSLQKEIKGFPKNYYNQARECSDRFSSACQREQGLSKETKLRVSSLSPSSNLSKLSL